MVMVQNVDSKCISKLLIDNVFHLLSYIIKILAYIAEQEVKPNPVLCLHTECISFSSVKLLLNEWHYYVYCTHLPCVHLISCLQCFPLITCRGPPQFNLPCHSLIIITTLSLLKHCISYSQLAPCLLLYAFTPCHTQPHSEVDAPKGQPPIPNKMGVNVYNFSERRKQNSSWSSCLIFSFL